MTIDFELFRYIEHPIVEYSLLNHPGAIIFRTSSSALVRPLRALDAGEQHCRIETSLTIQPQQCLMSIGLAEFDAGDTVVPIHRLANHARLVVTGAPAFGTVWCATTISRESDARKSPR